MSERTDLTRCIYVAQSFDTGELFFPSFPDQEIENDRLEPFLYFNSISLIFNYPCDSRITRGLVNRLLPSSMLGLCISFNGR